MEIDRIEQGAPDIVLVLLVGVISDADRASALIAAEVIEELLVELALTADPVHDLQRVLTSRHIGDEVKEVVGFPIEAEGVQRPKHEGGVADPAEAVVP